MALLVVAQALDGDAPEPALAWTVMLDSAHGDAPERPVQDGAVPVAPRAVVLLAARLPAP